MLSLRALLIRGVSRRRSANGSERRQLRLEALEPRRLLFGPADFGSLWTAEGEDGPMPDFALVDQNPASPTSGEDVSPRDYLGKVSGWYFGSAL